MLLSTVSVLVVAQSSSEIPEGLMNNPVQTRGTIGSGTYVKCDVAVGRIGADEQLPGS